MFFIKSLLKTFVLLLIFHNFSIACTLCNLEVPSVHVDVNANAQKDSTRFDISWKFGKEFTAEVLLPYDKNENKKYEQDELNEIKKSLEEYLQKENYLIFINYIHKNNDLKQAGLLEFKILNNSIKYVDYKMVYEYSIECDIAISKDNLLYIEFFDKNNYFDFILNEFNLNGIKPIELKKEKNYIKAYFYEKDKAESKIKKEQKDEVIKDKKSFLNMLAEILTSIKESMNILLTDIKETNSIGSYFWLLLFSFVYGIVHAIGPGHGKSLVSAYFLSEDRSCLKAFSLSAVIGAVHTFSAFILTFTVYYILESFLSKYFSDIDLIATKTSAVIIISIAIYLLYKKIPKISIKQHDHEIENRPFAIKPVSHISCGCSACKTNSTDLGVVLSAGVVPCPGTVTIFIFTMSLGIYLAGFLSAVFMSAGMSLIIFISAYLSIKVRDKAKKNKAVVKFIEYGSLVFILFLGFGLLLV